jgi:hypothetical protein
MDIQPQCHQGTSIKSVDHLPALNGRKKVTFGQLLPSICLGQGKSENDGAQWDVNQFGCFGCDAFVDVGGSLSSPYHTLLVFLLSYSSSPLFS